MQRLILMTGIFNPTIEIKDDNSDYPSAPSELILIDLDGKSLSLSSLHNKPVFVNIWATWCPPCRAEMPEIHALYQEMKNDVHFVMISQDSEKDKVKKYLETQEYQFPVYFTKGNMGALEGQSIPRSYVIDKQGKVVFSKSGMAGYNSKKFKDFLKELAEETSLSVIDPQFSQSIDRTL